MDSRFGNNPSNAKNLASERLGSWKAIANYLGKTVRTVQRWEKREGLPARRHQHGSGPTVFAYKHDLDQWMTRRSLVIHENRPTDQAAQGIEQSTPPDLVEKASQSGPRPQTRTWPLVLVAGLVLLTGALTWTQRLEKPGIPGFDTPLVPTNLTTQSGEERFPSLSPDGRQVVYVWTGEDGQTDLYVRYTQIDEYLRLNNDTAVEESPRWSPDGLSIAYLRRVGPALRELRIISAIGGNDRLLKKFYVPLSMDAARSISAAIDWSPNGRWIALTEGEQGSESMRLTLV